MAGAAAGERAGLSGAMGRFVAKCRDWRLSRCIWRGCAACCWSHKGVRKHCVSNGVRLRRGEM